MAEMQAAKQPMKTSNYVALMVVITLLVIIIGALVAKSLSATFLLNNRIISKKNLAQRTLAADVTSVQAITQQYQALGSQAQTINDALPSETDLPGFANALDALNGATGATWTSVATSGATSGATSSITPATSVANPATSTAASATGGAAAGTLPTSSTAPTPMPISIAESTTYNGLITFLQALESSSRPIQVNSISLSGTDAKLTVSISATTYYQTPVTFQIGKETVK